MTERIIGGCIFAVPALLMAVYAFFTARGKGPILSNGWIFLTPEQKKRENKKEHYRFVTVVFGVLAGAFALIALGVLTEWVWPSIASGILILFDLIYAIAVSIKAERKKKY